MVPHRSLDKFKLIAHILHDIHLCHGAVFNHLAYKLTLNKVSSRLTSEGVGFLTKTLPRLGKAIDMALTEVTPLTASSLRFKAQKGSNLPIFMGEFLNRVFSPDGRVLPDPCPTSVGVLRSICYLFYKYELPYAAETEDAVVQRFVKTENDLATVSAELDDLRLQLDDTTFIRTARRNHTLSTKMKVTQRARSLLSRLFARFDPLDIYPRHGPGAVSTKEKLWDKFLWTNVSAKITRSYPLDAYFYASLGHVCDCYRSFPSVTQEDRPARVVLVPKDSRGPRLISCEPVDYQWIQQGLGRAVVSLVEKHWITRFNVFFTDQTHNQIGALYGSRTGKYATLDLKDASDRVSLALVRLLFPVDLYPYLESCRSSATVLPDGLVLPLWKFAPMGSCLCFPIMALTIWAILTAAAPDTYTRERILVYGDDVIVPTAFAENAIEQLESFGLLVNRDKSCIRGFFRESCGVDAFKDVNVTPIRIRTEWSSTPTPESYSSWVAYANSFWNKKYYGTYDYIVSLLASLYSPLVTTDMHLACPSLPEVPLNSAKPKVRTNKRLQRREFKVLTVKSRAVYHEMDGWSMLLRYFSEKCGPSFVSETGRWKDESYDPSVPFSVRSYTRRRDSLLSRVWTAASQA